MMKTAAVALVLLIAVANSSPLVQNTKLVDAEKEIRAQLTTFFEGENVEDAKSRAKEVSDKIVEIFDDSKLTITEKATQVRGSIEDVVGKLNKDNVDKVFQGVLAKAAEVYLPHLENMKNSDFVQKGLGWVNGLLGKN